MRRYRRCSGLGIDGTLAMVLIGILALPIVGLGMLLKGNSENKALGVVLLVVGLIIWAFAFK